MNYPYHWISRWARFGLPLYLIVIAVACLLPSTETPPIGIRDKVLHASAYGIGAIMVMHGFLGERVRLLLLVFAWGVLMEIGQRFVPGRSFEFADMLANGIGIVIGVGIFGTLAVVIPKQFAQSTS